MDKPEVGWAIVDLMGHVRLAGFVSEEEHFGAKLGRVDIHEPNGLVSTQFFGANAIYRIVPTTEAIVRELAKQTDAAVRRFDLRALLPYDAPAPVVDWDRLRDDLPF